MNPLDERLDELIDAALDLPAARHDELLVERCGNDLTLLENARRVLAEIERHDLLPADGALRGKLFEDLCASLADAAADNDDAETGAEAAGSLVGRYRLERRLGQGGMGEVWQAEQLEPVRRQVAVKIIKKGLDTAQVVARFEAERQALALMDHPSIAKIYDAGSTPGGRPYFVMELVSGTSITEYSDRCRLTVAERLELFERVCAAMQHAHQKAIIHRDLKPSNVLVSEQGGNAVPKIIDFGVAKAIAPTPDQASLTELGQVIGTREYMSPEQAEGRVLEVDTRSDIYALGALLYTLLTGSPPFASEVLAGAGYGALRRLLVEIDPPTPSNRVQAEWVEAGAQADGVRRVADRRGTDPLTLRRRLRGDLDWIVMKALSKDRDQRYQSADALARDIERHLRHEPVLAGPPSAGYRARKFLVRNRGAVLSAAAVAISLIAGLVAATIFAVGQARARADADTARQEAEAVLEFLNHDLLEAVAPAEQGQDALLRDAVDAAAATIGDRFQARPQVEATIRMTLGNTYQQLGLYDEARSLLEGALDLLERQRPEDEARIAEALHYMANLHRDQGHYDLAVAALNRRLAIAERIFGPRSSDTAATLTSLGSIHSINGQFDEAERHLRRALDIQLEVFGEMNEHTSRTLGNLAVLYRRQARYEEAERAQMRALEIAEAMYGPEHPTVTIRRNNLAVLYTALGRYEEAEELLRRILATDEKLYGGAHPDVATDLFNLARALAHRGKNDEAIELYRRVLAIDEEALGPTHPRVGDDLVKLAGPVAQAGREGEAETLLRRGLAILEQAHADDHHEVGTALVALGDLLRRQGRHDEAEPVLRRARRVLEHVGNPVQQAHAARALGLLYRDQRHPDRAAPLLQQALTVFRRELPPAHPDVEQASSELRELEEGQRPGESQSRQAAQPVEG